MYQNISFQMNKNKTLEIESITMTTTVENQFESFPCHPGR